MCPEGQPWFARPAIRAGRDTNFENLRECLDDARVFITIHLHGVDEGDFGLRPAAEGLEDVGEALHTHMTSADTAPKGL